MDKNTAVDDTSGANNPCLFPKSVREVPLKTLISTSTATSSKPSPFTNPSLSDTTVMLMHTFLLSAIQIYLYLQSSSQNRIV
ncbi:hypothetical protein L1887_12780 [Cichorium endivia]|nr:hypothetical protein L1887_12780 [Cichorium endivia]